MSRPIKKIDRTVAITISGSFEKVTSCLSKLVRDVDKTFETIALFRFSIAIDVTGITSNVMPDGLLVIDIPLRAAADGDTANQSGTGANQAAAQAVQHRASLSDYIDLLMNSDFNPRLVDQSDGTKILEMAIDVKGCPPEEIKVSLKNNEIVVCGQCKHKENHHSKRSRFFRSTTLPMGAQTSKMKTELNSDGRLKIEVPLH